MILNNEWKSFLNDELHKDYYIKLQIFIDNEYKTKIIFPKYNEIFRAFNLLSPKKVKVIIVGQDPYHGQNQANGLAFSVCDKCKIPPSLLNIFKELHEDIGCDISACGNLTKWADEGVLLMNTVLTVIASEPNSHKNMGWEIFTDAVIKKLSLEYENIVFILWGAPSQKKALLIDESRHLILKAPHPSPLSSYRGFFGSKPFSKANNYLLACGNKEIDWCL
ncbi:MAG: uracil-DNA glycosylase [Campylobacterales bacterium]|nr:uracil-DNA glycosylase [Campylobacterales bacterium]